MRILLLIVFLNSLLFSYSINNSLLKIHATFIPKIILMDFNFRKKTLNNTISILIAYNKSDFSSAKTLKKNIERKYSNGIKSHQISVKIFEYNKLIKSDIKGNLYYLFPSNTQNIKKTLQKASKDSALTFSYLNKTLKDGVMCSVSVGSKTKPLLNLKAIKSNNITFRPVLLKISNIYKNEDGN